MAYNPMLAPAPKQQRVGRYPRHSFNVQLEPFQIVPTMIAPVLPGETLKNAFIQARAISEPVVDDLAGSWFNWSLFYVKLRDLAGREDFMNMMVDLTADMSSYKRTVSHDTPNFTFIGGMQWVQYCLDSVVGAYYRDQDDNPSDIGNYPAAMLHTENWMHSLTQDAAFIADEPSISTAGDNAFTASEVENLMQQWQYLKANNLIDMTYEDYLRAQGINLPDPEDEKPELIRTVTNWTYPANGVDPSTGSVRSVWSWSIAESADKPRLFKEPGFLFATACVKPKLYLSLQKGAVVGAMDNLLPWLPHQAQLDLRARMKNYAAGAGPLPSNTDDYWFDIGDLLSHGDQFWNWAIDQAEVAMPEAGGNFKYPTAAMINTLSVSGTSCTIRVDGVVQLNVASTIRDITPRGMSSVTV